MNSHYEQLKNGHLHQDTPDDVLVAYIAKSGEIPHLPERYRMDSPGSPEQALLAAIAYQQQSDASLQRAYALMNHVVDNLPDTGNALAAAAGHDYGALASMLCQERLETRLIRMDIYVDSHAVKEMMIEDRMLLQHVEWNIPVTVEFHIDDGYETKMYSGDYTCFGHLHMHVEPPMDMDVLEAELQKEMASNLDVEIEAMRVNVQLTR